MAPFGFHTEVKEVAEAFAHLIKDRTFLITGPSEKGLGANAAINLARQSPAQIILIGRNKSKVDPVIQEIEKANSGIRVKFVACDLTDLDSVRQAAQDINSDPAVAKIDVVINNAGVMAIKDFTTDKAGHELTLSANHIGHFLLTNLVMPKVLAAGKGARIVNVSSSGHQFSRFRFHDYDFSNGEQYDGWSAYGQSKSANILFSVELARRLADRGITAFSVHPGSIRGTHLSDHMVTADFDAISDICLKNTGKPFVIKDWKTLSEGTAPLLVAALDPALDERPGAYVVDCQVGEVCDYALDPENAKRLWDLSEELVGQRFPL